MSLSIRGERIIQEVVRAFAPASVQHLVGGHQSFEQTTQDLIYRHVRNDIRVVPNEASIPPRYASNASLGQVQTSAQYNRDESISGFQVVHISLHSHSIDRTCHPKCTANAYPPLGHFAPIAVDKDAISEVSKNGIRFFNVHLPRHGRKRKNARSTCHGTSSCACRTAKMYRF